MIQSGYTKLFGSIVASTVWNEDNETRIVWITLLALSDRDGYVAGSIPGLATLARVSISSCEKALEKLQQPDKYSRSPEHEGRRIKTVDGGWLILNRAKYRDLSWEQDSAQRRSERNRRYYQRTKAQDSDGPRLNSDASEVSDGIQTQEREREIDIYTDGSSTSLPSRKKKTRKIPLPEGFGISDRVRTWAAAKGHSRLEERLEHFIGTVKKQGYTYADWDEALMCAVREDWAKFHSRKPASAIPREPETLAETAARIAKEKVRVM